MVQDAPPPIALAAGTGDGGTGTDAMRVSEAILSVDGPDGVLVLMDLGSAVLSAEMALEFAEAAGEVRLSPAPLVEGLVAAVVRAAGGASLDEVDREARSAASAKAEQLGGDGGISEPAESSGASDADSADQRLTMVVTLVNEVGLHARPAGMLVKAANDVDATVEVAANGRGPVDAKSVMGLMTLGAARGTELTVTASGPDARRALDAIRELVEDGFGEDR
ncbi:hypothetical protein GCM10011490_09940 [Pseudoclavibacter endophyticus]|nr:hypothetical protein GCM10011490_09940 [Pseudoclavibacter endophyticus]